MLLAVQGLLPGPLAEDLQRTLSAVDALGGYSLWVADVHGQLLWLGASLGRDLGLDLEELQGRGLLDRVVAEESHALLTGWQHALAAGVPWAAKAHVCNVEGLARQASLRAEPVRAADGSIERWMGTFAFLQQRTAEVEELRQARDQLDVILRSVADGIFAQAEDGTVVFANDAAAHLLGLADAAALRETAGALDRAMAGLRAPDDSVTPAHNLPPARALRGLPSPEAMLRQGTAEGRDHWLTVKSTPISPTRSSDVRLAITILHDVTDLRIAEERVRGAQKMEAIGRLAGGIAHDFNNLLTAINGYSELLLQQMPRGDPSRPFLAEIRRSGERAASLTRQLLAYSRRQVLAPRHFNLNSVVAEMDKLLRRLIGEHIELVTHLEPQLGIVHADLGQIEQVLVNLAVNARDSMEEGGRLVIETANALVPALDPGAPSSSTHSGIPVVQPGHWVQLTVRDTGRGMDEETRSHIFEPFFTTKEFGKGTGLGLSTVEGIIQQSGGAITVESAPGRGSTFCIWFPRVQPGRQPIETSPGDEVQLRRGHETVLVVEDEAPVRELAQRMLELAGYKVLVARDGEDALHQADDDDLCIDLVLTDGGMPRMNGNDLAQRLMAGRSKLRGLFMSGYTDDVIVRRGLPETQTGFLQKPFSARQLQGAVRALLDEPLPPA